MNKMFLYGILFLISMFIVNAETIFYDDFTGSEWTPIAGYNGWDCYYEPGMVDGFANIKSNMAYVSRCGDSNCSGSDHDCWHNITTNGQPIFVNQTLNYTFSWSVGNASAYGWWGVGICNMSSINGNSQTACGFFNYNPPQFLHGVSFYFDYETVLSPLTNWAINNFVTELASYATTNITLNVTDGSVFKMLWYGNATDDFILKATFDDVILFNGVVNDYSSSGFREIVMGNVYESAWFDDITIEKDNPVSITNILSIWDFEPNTGFYNGSDSYNYDNNITSTIGNPDWTNEGCIFGEGCVYLGGGDAFYFNTTGFPSGNIDFSLSMWLNASNYGGHIFGFGKPNANNAMLFAKNDSNNIFVGKYGADSIASTDIVTLNEWHLIGFSKQGDNVTYYIDGNRLNTVNMTGQDVVFSEADCYGIIGKSYLEGAFVTGKIDRIITWDGILSDEQWQNLYNITPCTEDWTVIYTNQTCNISDYIPELKTYEDLNECGTVNDLPIDNGTISSTYLCNYCLEDIQTLYTSFGECILPQQLQYRIKYYIDNNFITCCNITSLSTDCHILNGSYINSSDTQSCTEYYRASDIPLIATDNLGAAGVAFVDWIPLIIFVLCLSIVAGAIYWAKNR